MSALSHSAADYFNEKFNDTMGIRTRDLPACSAVRENILDMVQRSPHLSTRRMASRVGLSRMNEWRTLHEENLYPYHDQRVQHLEPGDHAKRMDLCHWVNAHPELLSAILFTDEASFTRDGINNLRNVHTWAHRNPHATCVILFIIYTTGFTPSPLAAFLRYR